MPVKAEGPSSAAVQAKTGKTWEEWYAILDAAGATTMSHKAIAEYLYEKQGVPGWWAQSVTVGYERARGIREKYQKADGFSASRSKTFDAPLDKLYEAWADAKIRKRGCAAPRRRFADRQPTRPCEFHGAMAGRT